MGEALSFAYDLLDHPALLDQPDQEDLFIEAMDRPELYKRFNRTIIERTIVESAYYGKLRFENTFLSIAGKGIEMVLKELVEIVTLGNILYQESRSKKHDASFDVNYRFFQLTSKGKITGAILGIIDSCQTLILQSRKKYFETKLAGMTSDEEKRVYLLRQKADLQKQKDSSSESIYNGLMEFFQIELDFFQNSSDRTDELHDLKVLVESFFLEQNAKISNDALLASLVNTEIETFKRSLTDLVQDAFSYHDISGKEPEKLYHVLLITLLHRLSPQYEIKSNRESGTGRFDILLLPQLRFHKGVIFEVKKIENSLPQQIQNTLQNALAQIESNKYYMDLKTKGVRAYVAIAAVFEGKNLHRDHSLNKIPQ